MKKYIINLYHRIISAFILFKYKDIQIAKEKSFKYYNKNVKYRKYEIIK
jgi:hypothetical protein